MRNSVVENHGEQFSAQTKSRIDEASKKKSPIRSLFVTRRWIVVIVIGLATILVEIIEHSLAGEDILTTHFLSEIIIFGLAIPLIGLVLLGFINKAEMERDLVIKDMDQHIELSHELAGAKSMGELGRNIVQLTKTIIPAARTHLYLPDLEKNTAELIDFSDRGPGSNPPQIPNILTLDECQQCTANLTVLSNRIRFCPEFEFDSNYSENKIHCLPLVYREGLTGMLLLELPSNSSLDARQTRSLASIAPEIALAIENVRIQQAVSDQNIVAVTERARIAQHLHDTLGQNLSLLRMKLDQLSSEDTLKEIVWIRRDMENMLTIADDAYDQVRNTLEELHPYHHMSLNEAISLQMNAFEKRTDFDIRLTESGDPRSVTPMVKRQVLYICREALNNIEKHAGATKVDLPIDWEPEGLSLKITDDGCGFHLTDSQLSGKFGLVIMMERAEQIGGQLNISSIPGQGTTVSLWLPL